MNIETLFLRKTELDGNFSYKDLYNDDLGAVHKESSRTLLYQGIAKNVISVEKFIVAEDVREELYQITEDTTGLKYTLIECLKEYHNESPFVIAPFIYLMKRIDANYSLSNRDGKFEVESKIDIKVCPRVDGANATPRLFLPEYNTAFASMNDNIENLMDILTVKGLTVYVIGTHDRSKTIIAYKVSRTDEYFEVAHRYKQQEMDELFRKKRNFEV